MGVEVSGDKLDQAVIDRTDRWAIILDERVE
jgi:hypothetical protein